MTDYILKAVAEVEQEVLISLNLFASEIDLHGYTPENHRQFTNRIVSDIKEKLEHLAKQKDEEFMGMIGSDEPARPCNNCYNPNVMADKMCVNCASAEGRNFKAYELRTRLDSARQDKLQGGTGK